jgi:hypothetical protein
VVRNPGVYRERIFSYRAWKKLLSGRVNIWRIVEIYIRRFLLACESTLRDLARAMQIRLPQDLGWELEEVGARGVCMIFIFSRGEPGLDLLKLGGGRSVKRLGERCRVHVIEGGDHVFSQSDSRAAMERIISDELYARAESGPRLEPN